MPASEPGSGKLVRRLVFFACRVVNWGLFTVAGFAGLAGNTFRFAFARDVLVELVHDVLQLLVAVGLFSVG